MKNHMAAAATAGQTTAKTTTTRKQQQEQQQHRVGKTQQRDEATSIRASHLACRINFILYLEGRPCVCVVSVCARLVCVFVLALLSIFSRQGKGRVWKGAPCNGRINLNCIICCAAKEKKLSQWPKQNKYKYRLEQDRHKKRERERA